MCILENLTEPPANKEKRGLGGGFNLLKPSNSDTFLALARRASNASRGSDEEDGANGVGERGKTMTEETEVIFRKSSCMALISLFEKCSYYQFALNYK